MWKTAGCAVTGEKHRQNQLPCQDQVASLEDQSFHAIALADGAGSAKHSEEGALLVVREALQFLHDHFEACFESNAYLKIDCLDYLQQSLEKYAEEKSCAVRDLYSTLMLIAVKDNRLIGLHIGDGVMGSVKNDEIHVFSKPTNGEFLNETVFVSLAQAGLKMKIYKEENFTDDGFVLMSDGAAESFYNRIDETLVPVLGKLANELRSEDPKGFTEDLIFTFEDLLTRRTSDDCAIQFMVLSDEEAPEEVAESSEEFETSELKSAAVIEEEQADSGLNADFSPSAKSYELRSLDPKSFLKMFDGLDGLNDLLSEEES